MTFDMAIVLAHFRKCVTPNGDIVLTEYIAAYKELNKLFTILGRLFSFVESDVADKEDILAKYIKADPAHYSHVCVMVDYEVGNDTAIITDPASGSRTLLRLHRALAYVLRLVKDIANADDHSKTSHIARSAYDGTLGNYHPWMIRQAVHLAVHTLPSTKQLIHDLSGGRPIHEAKQIMNNTVTVGGQVYDLMQAKFKQKNCLDLP